jgi:hypothetical protein
MSVVVGLRLAAAVLVLVVVGPGCVAATARAATPTEPPGRRCSDLWTDPRSGTVADVVVEGDLLVDAYCALVRTTVTGDATLLDGGALDLQFEAVVRGDVHGTVEPSGWDPSVNAQGATIGGDVVVPGYAHLRHTSVHGDVVLEAGTGRGGLILDEALVAGAVRGTADSVLVEESAVLGPVDVTTGEGATRVRRSTLGASLRTGGGRLVLHDSRIRGALESAGSRDVLVCRSQVDGDLTVTDVQGWSRVGEERGESCRTTVGGSVHLVDNTHSIVLGDLRVAGDLVCTGNTGPQGVVRTERLAVAGTGDGECPVGPPLEEQPRPSYLCSALSTGWFGGEVRDRHVRGDLVADTMCRLEHVTVLGDVTSVEGGHLAATWSTITGSVDVQGGIWLERSTVLGDVDAASAEPYELSLGGSRVAGDLTGAAGSTRVDRSAVVGAYDVVTTGYARFRHGVLGGPVRSGGGRLHVHDTTAAGDVLSVGSAEVLVCRSTVGGDLTVTQVQAWSRIGVERAAHCATRVGGSLVLVDNPHSLVVGDVAVDGDLVCRGNTGPQGVTLSESLTVGGTRPASCS